MDGYPLTTGRAGYQSRVVLDSAISHLQTHQQRPQDLLEREAAVAAHLEEKVAEFRAKKFTPPQRPVACEEEAAQLLACYRWVGGCGCGFGGRPTKKNLCIHPW